MTKEVKLMDTPQSKNKMTEEDIKLQFITPAIEKAGWDKSQHIKMDKIIEKITDILGLEV